MYVAQLKTLKQMELDWLPASGLNARVVYGETGIGEEEMG